MPIGRSKEEAELNERLVKGLVAKEVLEPMEKIGWGHGAPPPPDYSGPPAAGAEGAAPEQKPTPAAKPEGGPPDPKAGTDPAPADKLKADAPQPETAEALLAMFESLRDPETGLIMKKYRTVADALKGSGHLANMAKQALSDRDIARAELGKLREENVQLRVAPAAPAAAPVATQVPAPSREALDRAQAKLDKVLSSIAENGGILDGEAARSLSAANRELADATADFRVQEDRASRAQAKEAAEKSERDWAAVDAYMRENHPDAERFSEEVALNLQSDSLLMAAVNALFTQGKRIEGTELAWKAFQRVHGDQIAAKTREQAEEKEQDLAAREQVRKEQVDKARKDAGIVEGSAGGAGVHEGGQSRASREEIEAAREAMRREGDAPGSPAAMRFRALVIGPSLDPSFFGGR